MIRTTDSHGTVKDHMTFQQEKKTRKHLLNPQYEFSKTDLTRQNERVSDGLEMDKFPVRTPNSLFPLF